MKKRLSRWTVLVLAALAVAAATGCRTTTTTTTIETQRVIHSGPVVE